MQHKKAPFGLSLVGTTIECFQYRSGGQWVELTNGYMDADSSTYGLVIRDNCGFIKQSMQTQSLPSHNPIALASRALYAQAPAMQAYGQGYGGSSSHIPTAQAFGRYVDIFN
jgi:hypothetical protein